eukprot:228636-Rhodomonas_salina.1
MGREQLARERTSCQPAAAPSCPAIRDARERAVRGERAREGSEERAARMLHHAQCNAAVSALSHSLILS